MEQLSPKIMVAKVVSQGSGYIELNIKSHAKIAASICADLYEACTYINNSIAEMKPVNHISPSHSFKATFTDDFKKLEVWHYNLTGDKDRLVITIES